MFDTVAEAVEKTGADATMIFVPPPFAADAILEAADAGIRVDRRHHRRHSGARHGPRGRSRPPHRRRGSIGPNCPGVITPEECKIGIMPGYIHKQRPGRRDQPLGHADLRGGVAVDEPRAGAIDLRRPGRRPDRGHVVRRSAEDVRGRPGDRRRS